MKKQTSELGDIVDFDSKDVADMIDWAHSVMDRNPVKEVSVLVFEEELPEVLYTDPEEIKRHRINYTADNRPGEAKYIRLDAQEIEDFKKLMEWPEIDCGQTEHGWIVVCGESTIAENLDKTGATTIVAALKFAQKAIGRE